MFSNQKVPNGESLDLSSIGLINVVPHFCPGVRKVFFGHWQSSNGSIPHSLCDEDAYFDAKVSYFSYAKIYTTVCFFYSTFRDCSSNLIKKVCTRNELNQYNVSPCLVLEIWFSQIFFFGIWGRSKNNDRSDFFMCQNMHHLRLIKDIGRIRLGHSIS